MAVPGPPAALWAAALIVWALAAAVLGEAVRFLAARYVPSWRTAGPIERCLLDFYLGGASLYLVAAIPVGAFGRPVVYGLPIVAGLGLLAVSVRRRRARSGAPAASPSGSRVGWAPIVAVATALGLFAVELAATTGIGTGNTFDSSLLTTYTALLLQHGRLPLSFQPYASQMILYPQGTTVWLGWAQLDFGLPPARVSLLVTPLFLALAPLAGFVFGRRMLGTERAGAALAVGLGVLGPATRSLVGGSNDFAFAFPLVLLLAAQTGVWTRSEPPGWGDAIAYGVLLGYSAAINPVGAEWLFPTLVLVGAVGAPGGLARARHWFGRWLAAVAAGLMAIAPTLYVLALGLGSPGFVPGAATPPVPTTSGISPAQLFGSIDPFLFRASDIALSPVPLLRAELAILLVVGVVALWVRSSDRVSPDLAGFARWTLGAAASIVGWLLVLTAAGADWPVARDLANLSSGAELSLWLFSLYGLVATVPLVLLLEWADRGPAPPLTRPGSDTARFRRARGGRGDRPIPTALLPIAAAGAIVAPGIVLTPASLAPVLRTLYDDFGTVSPADFALLACAGANLPVGSRVLVAPGSAAEFLPGYARGITLLYPLVPNWPWLNASYRLLVHELENATLDASGTRALAALHVDYVAVTEANTILWPPFSPAPFLDDPSAYPAVFASGDAYLFSTSPGALPFACG